MISPIQIRLNPEEFNFNIAYICDTYEDEVIQYSRRVQSIETLMGQQESYSQTFRLPLKGQLLELLGDITNPTFKSNINLQKEIAGSILIENIPIYFGAFTVVNAYYNIDKNLKEVELFFRGKESSIKARTANILLTDLFRGETIPYNETIVAGSFSGELATNNQYRYILADYGQQWTGTILESAVTYDNFKPAITPKFVFDKLFEEHKILITYDTSIVDLVEKQVHPLHNNNSRIPTLTTTPLDGTGRILRTNNLTLSTVNNFIWTKLQFNVEENFSTNYFDLANDNWEAPFDIPADSDSSVSINLRIRLEGTKTFNAARPQIKIGLFKNGVINSEFVFLPLIPEGSGAFSESFSLNRTYNLSLLDGDVIDFRMQLTTTSFAPSITTIDTIIVGNVDGRSSFVINQLPQVQASSEVLISPNLDEKMTAFDFIKTIIGQCNGIVELTEDGFKITPYNEWIKGGEDLYLDDHLVTAKDLVFEPTGVTGAKSILFSYLEDSDFYNESYTDITDKIYGERRIENTGSEFATDTFEVKIPFAPTPPIPVIDTDIYIPKFIDEDGECIKGKPRLLYFSDDLFGTTIIIKDVFSATELISRIPVVGHWQTKDGGFNTNDYNFGQSLTYFASSGYPNNNLYNRFWRDYVLQNYSRDSKKLKTQVDLPRVVIQSLKMNENVKLLNAGFTWNAIENFSINKREPISIELSLKNEVSRLSIAPFWPYDVIAGIVQWKDSTDNTDLGDASGEDAADLELSCIAYGFFYDDVNNIGVQFGKIIEV